MVHAHSGPLIRTLGFHVLRRRHPRLDSDPRGQRQSLRRPRGMLPAQAREASVDDDGSRGGGRLAAPYVLVFYNVAVVT
jgi:hypothetical protein